MIECEIFFYYNMDWCFMIFMVCLCQYVIYICLPFPFIWSVSLSMRIHINETCYSFEKPINAIMCGISHCSIVCHGFSYLYANDCNCYFMFYVCVYNNILYRRFYVKRLSANHCFAMVHMWRWRRQPNIHAKQWLHWITVYITWISIVSEIIIVSLLKMICYEN